jgi:sec-independent protein translocase protein TatA
LFEVGRIEPIAPALQTMRFRGEAGFPLSEPLNRCYSCVVWPIKLSGHHRNPENNPAKRFLSMTPLFGFFNLGAPEMIVLLILGVLLFGRKLPEVGRYLGKGIVEFKKGIKGLEDEFDPSTTVQRQEPMPLEQPRPPQRITTTAPKFDDNITTPANNLTTPPKA